MNLFKGNGKKAEDMENGTVAIKVARCPQNHPCPSVRVCPVGALKQKGYAAPTVDQSTCIKCGKCVRYCPMRAIVIE